MTLLKYSLRDVILIILVIAVGLGWFVDHVTLSGEAAKARAWQGRTDALVDVLELEGYEIEWDPKADQVALRKVRPSRVVGSASFRSTKLGAYDSGHQ